ncbi:MAG: hypothetical protein QNJ23_08535 [Woeseiaceae bacterium]|nr:hypothetical protein [Woeseiaceae bacterium]
MKTLTALTLLILSLFAFGQLAADSHGGKHECCQNITHVLITHEVEDGARWLAAWSGPDSRHKLFKENGAKMVHTFQDGDNPNLTGLVVAVTDMDKFMAMLESDEGQAAAGADGVKMDTMVLLVEKKQMEHEH